jgi:DNA-binding GntR family transcriptional regulator
MINPRSRKHAWLQLGELLKARIESGDLPVGERIESETELMDAYDVGRTTARRAVAWLREQGLVETEPKRGTYVVKQD